MNPPDVGGAKVFNELYAGTTSSRGDDGNCKRPSELSLDELESAKRWKPTETSHGSQASKNDDSLSRRIYVGGLSPSVTERPLVSFFTDFGERQTLL